MWFLGSHKHQKEHDNESNSKRSTESHGSSKRSRVRKLGRNKSNSDSNSRTASSQPVALTSSPMHSTMMDEDSMLLDETYSGIEVSLHQNNAAEVESAPRNAVANYRRNSANGFQEQALSATPPPTKATGRSRDSGRRGKRRNPTIPPCNISTTMSSLMSIQQQAATAMQKVYQAQFNVIKWNNKSNNNTAMRNSGTTYISETNSSTTNAKNGLPYIGFHPRPHRIPLFSEEKKDCNESMLYDDMFSLLTNQPVIDEETLVRRELDSMDTELLLLEADRQEIEKLARDHPESNFAINGISSSALSNTNASDRSTFNSGLYPWNLHQQLFSGTNTATSFSGVFLSKPERHQLQEQRGLNLTLQLQNPYAQEALMAKCGCIQKMPYQTTITVGPHNCRDGGGASTIQHVQLVQASSSTAPSQPLQGQNSTAAIFLSRDAGPSYCSGERGGLPDRLYGRLRAEGHQNASNILYLVTGPHDSYYTEFRSGECWWGCPDADFGRLCQEWDVHRVAFGPAKELWDPLPSLVSGDAYSSSPNSSDSSGSKLGSRNRRKQRKHRKQDQAQKQQHAKPAQNCVVCFSWLIVCRDGRAAWKNLPARLHGQLSRRLASESAPVEFSLGPGDSYFVRWLDGTSDWQLSAAAAAACERLEKHSGGGRTAITSVALHHSAPDFMVRHRSVHQSRIV